jgi:hypothetical protein
MYRGSVDFCFGGPSNIRSLESGTWIAPLLVALVDLVVLVSIETLLYIYSNLLAM